MEDARDVRALIILGDLITEVFRDDCRVALRKRPMDSYGRGSEWLRRW